MNWTTGRDVARVSLLALACIAGACSDSSDEVATDGPTTTAATTEATATASSDSSSDSDSPQTTSAGTEEEGTDVEDTTTSTSAPNDVLPARFFAITADTYELVEVDTASGEILGRFGGWGQSLDDCGEDCSDQAIDWVDLGTDGRLWVTDCCEPAAGNIYALIPGETFDPTQPFGFGLNPSVSPDERLLAYAALEDLQIGPVGFSTADPSTRFPSARADGEPPAWYAPVAWLDDTTLVVRVSGDLVDNLIQVDVSEWAEPVQIGPIIGGLVLHPDAAVRADGMIVALTRTPGEGDDVIEAFDNPMVTGQVFDPFSGEMIAEFDLPDDVYAIDYDPTATFLLTVGEDSVVRWYGVGQSGELGSGFVAATW